MRKDLQLPPRSPLAVQWSLAARVLCALQVIIPSQVFSVGYSVKGTLTYEGHGMGEPLGQEVTPFVREFEVVADDSIWTTRMIPVGDANYAYYLTTYDGSNILYFDAIRPEVEAGLLADLQAKPSGKGLKSVLQSCSVEATPVPRARSSTGGVYAWLALASGNYFKALDRGMAVDLYALEARQGLVTARREVPCEFEVSSARPNLPVRVAYFWTNLAHIRGDGVVASRALPLPFHGRFLAAEYISEAFTNIGGLSIPLKFQIKEYRPLPLATNANDYRCTLIVRGVVTAVSTAWQHRVSDLYGKELQVTDLRYPYAPMYIIKDGVLPEPNDRRVSAGKAEALRRAGALARQEQRASGRRALWVALAVAVFCSPIVVILFRNVRKEEPQ